MLKIMKLFLRELLASGLSFILFGAAFLCLLPSRIVSFVEMIKMNPCCCLLPCGGHCQGPVLAGHQPLAAPALAHCLMTEAPESSRGHEAAHYRPLMTLLLSRSGAFPQRSLQHCRATSHFQGNSSGRLQKALHDSSPL